MKFWIMSLTGAANIFAAIRYRQPIGFVVAGLVAVVMIYCYLTDSKEKRSK